MPAVIPPKPSEIASDRIDCAYCAEACKAGAICGDTCSGKFYDLFGIQITMPIRTCEINTVCLYAESKWNWLLMFQQTVVDLTPQHLHIDL